MVKFEMNMKFMNLSHNKLIFTFLSFAFANANAKGYYFSDSELNSFGVPVEYAHKLLKNNSFQPGSQRLSFFVNGQAVHYEGRIYVGSDGQPCLTQGVLNDIDINGNQLKFDKSGCLLLGNNSGLIVKPNAKLQQIEILAPDSFISSNKDNYISGGNAALLNYSLHGFNTWSKYSDSNSYSGFITSGFNTDNWIFRNYSTISNYNGKDKFENTQTYFQKTFEPQGKLLRIGDVDYYDKFYGVSLLGIQWTPDPSLIGGWVTSLQGFSNEDSQIEVYQLGQLVYVGRVHAGYYKITSVPVLNSQSSYEVVLTSPNGAKSKTLVTAAEASIYQNMKQNNGLSFAAGKATNIKNKYYNEPIIATASYNWGGGENFRFGYGILGTEDFYSIASEATYNITPRNSVSLTQYLSAERRASSKDVTGSSSGIVLINALGKNITLSNSLIYKTNGYRGIEDIGTKLNTNYKWQQSNSLSANLKELGNLGVTYSFNESQIRKDSNYSLTWGRNLFSAYLTATLQKQKIEHNNKLKSETKVYAQLSVPISNRQRITSSYTSGEKWHRLSTDYRKSENSGLNYGIGYTRDNSQTKKQDTVFLEASKTTRLAHVGGRLNINDDYKSLSTYISGGVIFDKNALILSPYEIGDTFGAVNIGEFSGIEVLTPNGKVWTDRNGNAVISTLNPFSNNLIEINTKTAPKNLDVMSGIKKIKPYRGTFKRVNFDAKEVKRVVVYAVDKNSKALPYGSLVTDSYNDAIIGFVDEGGMIFFNDTPKRPVNIILENKTVCSMNIDPPPSASDSDVFTTLYKTCY